MDEYQDQRQNEIGLSDVFRILLKRLKLLIVILLAGVVIGGLFGYFTYKDKKYYGAEVKYEISIIPTRMVYASNGSTKTEPGKAPNYIYKEQHISMLIDHLNSDIFSTELLKQLDDDSAKVVAAVMKDGEIDVTSMLVSDDENEVKQAKYYLSQLSGVKSSISFYFDYDTNPNSFFMKVSVKEDPDFAAKILAAAKKCVPLEVSGTAADEESGTAAKPGHIIVPDSTDTRGNNGVGTVTSYTAKCTPMKVSYSHLLNPGNARKKAILFGAIFGLGALLIACVAVVVADNSDERLRDYDKFSKSLGMPVLGVIPSIDYLSAQEVRQKKKEEKIK
mgnify:CR=1 FL=1